MLVGKINSWSSQCNAHWRKSQNGHSVDLCVHACSLSHVQLCNPMDCSSPCSSVHKIFQARYTGAGCHFLLQGIFLTQGSSLRLFHLLHWQADSLPLSHLGGPSWPVLVLRYLLKIKLQESIHLAKCQKSRWTKKIMKPCDEVLWSGSNRLLYPEHLAGEWSYFSLYNNC